MTWVDRYIGKPFEDGGRGPDFFDCWGLVRDVYAVELGIDLPEYGEISARDLIRVARTMQEAAQGRDVWLPTISPRQFDIVGMRLPHGGHIGHVGVMVDTRTVLHVEAATHAVQVTVAHISVAHRIAGYWRHSEI